MEKNAIALLLKRKPVAVRLLFSQQAYDELAVEEFGAKTSYCYMIKSASTGKHFKASLKHFNCIGATTALRLEEMSPEHKAGDIFANVGLYRNHEIAYKAQQEITMLEQKVYGVEISPLGEMGHDPDVVIIVDTANIAMRLSQAYAYQYGKGPGGKNMGNQAICSESTAIPFLTQEMNISLLCSGTRFFSQWDEGDVAVGIPFAQWAGIQEGALATLNCVENNTSKEALTERYGELGVPVVKNAAYFYKNKAVESI